MHAGEKLIDHLKKWLEPDKVVTLPHSWDTGEEAAVAAATLNLFHLLPNQAVKFLETSVICPPPGPHPSLSGRLARRPCAPYPMHSHTLKRALLDTPSSSLTARVLIFFLSVSKNAVAAAGAAGAGGADD